MTTEDDLRMDALFLLNSAALGVGLAMDAFSVSLANGLHEPNMTRRRMSVIAGTYAGFQFLMPMIGWILVSTIASLFSAFQRMIPVIALLLLGYIGIKMIMDGLREKKEGTDQGVRSRITPKLLLIQGVATSIDALSVGFTIADYRFPMATLAALIIACVTFIICLSGLFIGRKAGTRLAWRASILGGCILIAIGLEIFIKGFLLH